MPRFRIIAVITLRPKVYAIQARSMTTNEGKEVRACKGGQQEGGGNAAHLQELPLQALREVWAIADLP